jgi:hypothetical protein
MGLATKSGLRTTPTSTHCAAILASRPCWKSCKEIPLLPLTAELEWLLETRKIVTIEERATDAEGRIIAQVWINSTDVNGTMREFLSK